MSRLASLSNLASVLACLPLLVPNVCGEETDRPIPAFVDTGEDLEADFAVESSESEADENFDLSNWLQDAQPPAILFEPQVEAPASSSELAAIVFGSGDIDRSLLSQARRARAMSLSSDVVFGAEGKFRVATDGGSLLGKSNKARGITIQKRNPIVADPRIRGDRVGRLVASGSYWFPARQDLDTMLNKIDARLIENMIVIKGPYSARYGPGFDFVDFQLAPSPRFDGYNGQGSTSVEYLTNGAQFYGRQMAMGGDTDYGYRVSYGHRTGNDYETGNGSRLPTSYNSRDLDLALGYDVNDDSNIEFNYLRLDQTGVEFPGLVFDISALVTDGFSTTYTLENQPGFDLLTLEGWYNATRFNGNTLGAGKNKQIPSLVNNLAPFGIDGVPGYAATDVDAYSAGYRLAVSWGDAEYSQTTIGTDFLHLGQQLNDVEDPLSLVVGATNFPIPRSHSTDVGIFLDTTTYASDRLRLNAGARVDFVNTDSRETAPYFFDYTFSGFTTYSEIAGAGLDQYFTLASAFVTADYEINPCWKLTGGAGHGERPPTMTEMYANQSFIGTLQPGLTTLEGDPELNAEKRTQIDVGLWGDLGRTRVGASGFYAWINDAIVYEWWDADAPGFTPTQDFQTVVLGNTDLATMTGVELSAERDLRDYLTGFVLMSYVQGTDRSRNNPTRLGTRRRELTGLYPPNEPRSLATDNIEPLPGIVPLQARAGLRLHEPTANPYWGLELEARIVNRQNRVATSLAEIPTPGFTIWNLRGFWRPYEQFTVIAGVENFGNKYYREHLDFRSGLGVFQPGTNFYCSTELTY